MADHRGFEPVSTVFRLFGLNIFSEDDFVVNRDSPPRHLSNTTSFSSQSTSDVVNAFNMMLKRHNIKAKSQ